MANISKIQFLRSPTAGKVPTAAQLDEGSIALNTTDRIIYTKVGNTVIPLNDGFGKSLLIANRLSELSTNTLDLIKAQNDNLGSMITRPISLDQIGTGVNKPTRFDDDRLLDLNQIITINGNMDDGPVTGATISTGVLINTRRAFAAGPMYTQEYINAGGVRYVRTGGAKNATTGIPAWNGLASGADANGWRRQFDSAVLPTLVELGAAKSGVNADITQMNALTLVRGGNTDFDGSIYQIGGARTFQNNYRIGLIRDRFSTGAAVNPYLTFVQKDVGDGDLLPTANRVIGRIEYKVSSPTADDYAGRSIGAYQVWLDPNGNGIAQISTSDSAGVNTMIDMYAANGNVNIRNKSITSFTTNQGSMLVGSLTNLSNAPLNGDYLFGVATRDTGTGGGSSTYIGHNGGTPSAPVYSHYFRGKGVLQVDVLGGLLSRTGITNTGTITSTGAITVSGSGASSLYLGSGTSDVFIRNTSTTKALQIKDNGDLSYSDQKIYYEGFKPTAVDVGALPITGGTLTGPLNVSSGNIASLAGNVTTPNLFLAGGAYGSTSGLQFSGAGGGPTGVFVGSGDGASYTTSNMTIRSWFGVGFASSQGTNGTTVVINTRSGDISTKGTISSGGLGIFSQEVRCLAQDSYRLTSGSSVFQRFDGNNWWFMMSDTATGTWNNLRPLSINKASGDVTLGHSVIVNGGLNVGGNGNSWGGGITLGDNDSGFRGGGDGVIQIWTNNARKVNIDPSQVYVDVELVGAANGNFNNVYIRSDINFKKNLIKLPGLDALNELTGYSYDVKQISDSGEKWTKSAGLIAQDAQKVLPDAVTEDANGLNLNYNAVIALLVNSVKELQAQVEELKAKV